MSRSASKPTDPNIANPMPVRELPQPPYQYQKDALAHGSFVSGGKVTQLEPIGSLRNLKL